MANSRADNRSIHPHRLHPFAGEPAAPTAYPAAGAPSPPPPDRSGPPDALAVIPLTGSPGMFGNLAAQLHHAGRVGCDWLVLTLHRDGSLDIAVWPTPRPAPPAHWRDARL